MIFFLAPLSGPNVNLTNTGSWSCISRTALQISVSFSVNIHDSYRMNPGDFGDSMTFPPAAAPKTVFPENTNNTDIKYFSHVHTVKRIKSLHFGHSMSFPFVPPSGQNVNFANASRDISWWIHCASVVGFSIYVILTKRTYTFFWTFTSAVLLLKCVHFIYLTVQNEIRRHRLTMLQYQHNCRA